MTDGQLIGEDVPVVPELSEEDQELIRKEVVKEAHQDERPTKRCIVCGKPALYCMRGLPQNTYCRPCAQEYFKFLNYLERL